MKAQYHDILVLKEYETYQDGKIVKHKSWNRVGRAWKSRSEKSLNMELFLMPGQKYVVTMRDRQPQEPQTQIPQPTSDAVAFDRFDDIPF